MPENLQNRQVQSIMFVIMTSEGPGVRAVHPDLGPRPPENKNGRQGGQVRGVGKVTQSTSLS